MYPTLLLASVAAALLSACGGGLPTPGTTPAPSQAPTPAPSPSPAPLTAAGVWLAPAYGYALQITPTAQGYRWARFDYTSQGCLLSETQQLAASELAQRLQIDPAQRLAQYREAGQVYSPGIEFAPASALPTQCSEAQRRRTVDEAGYRADPNADLQLIWHTFAEHYHDFHLSQTDWRALRPAANALAASAGDAEVFAAACTLTSALQDGHVSIFYGEDSCTTTRKPMLSVLLAEEYANQQQWAPPFSSSQQAALQDYVSQGIQQRKALPALRYAHAGTAGAAANQQLQWFITAEGYGYLAIHQLSGFSAQDTLASDVEALEAGLTQALQQLGQTKGLIIDLRYNPGGYDETALRVMRRLLPAAQTLFSKQARLGETRTALRPVRLSPAEGSYRQPIAALISNSTFSAGEILALSLRSRPRTVLIGEASGGALSDTLVKRTSGKVNFSLSNEFYYSPQGEWFEARGVPVSVPAALPSSADLAQQHDPGMVAALAWLRQQ
ncbi:S41 family peptidase [Chitinibacter tainanensis]|uniref:S41 family peptidase n=1 Tax=Chitinibacter tainanensis TaxID=230667 RepID=UPI0023538DD3|nr:S41 family peptidase [Chitinibacter tainanensis]